MNLKKIFIRVFYSCDGLRGFALYPEDFWGRSRFTLLQYLSDKVSKNKKQKLQAIVQNSSELSIVSIILPALNSEKTIAKAIESIQAQSYPHWELLIVDDGSTDHTQKIVSNFISEDSRIRLFYNNKNKGAAYARNVGLHYAAGDYITFHDADDVSHVERLEYQLGELLLCSKTKLVVPQYVRVNNKNEILVLNGSRKRNYISGMMFRKQIIEKVGYFKPLKISEDSEFYERIIATYGKGARKILCKTLYYALFSPDSLLFSNARVAINGNNIDYKIHDNEFSILEVFRSEHKQISMGKLSPYQSFTVDRKVTKTPYE